MFSSKGGETKKAETSVAQGCLLSAFSAQRLLVEVQLWCLFFERKRKERRWLCGEAVKGGEVVAVVEVWGGTSC